jgi:hypothetical protein
MSFRDTIRVIQPGRRRLKIFVDFWNVVVNARNISKNIDVDVRWDRLVDQVVAETSSGHSDDRWRISWVLHFWLVFQEFP